MKFSIVTVCKNGDAYLDKMLDSVASQTYLDIEHIFFDGGSIDQSLTIAHQYPHLKVIEGRDTGISDAMNKGAAYATGDFLLHLHTDDLLAAPNVLEKVATSLKQHPHIQWLYGQTRVIDEKGTLKRLTPYLLDATNRLWKYNTITHPSTVISRALFEQVEGFSTHRKYCMDYDLWMRLAPLAPPLAYPGVIACFREHHESLSTSEPLKVADEAYQIRNKYIKNPLKRWRSYRTWKRRKKKVKQQILRRALLGF
ncbi:MAG: glycosyltransferase [Chlamydiia bacterium]|nr:glycosyltransferase [Chlamydiia bacterium]